MAGHTGNAMTSERNDLQEELDKARQQLQDAEQTSKAALAAQMSQLEVAWKNSQQESEQRLQQALREVAVGDTNHLQPSEAVRA